MEVRQGQKQDLSPHVGLVSVRKAGRFQLELTGYEIAFKWVKQVASTPET